MTWGALLVGLGSGGTAFNLYRPVDLSRVVLVSVGVSLALGVFFCALVLLLRWLGVHRYPLRGLIDVGLIAGLLAVGFGGTAAFNGALDPHPLEEQEAQVVWKHSHWHSGTEIKIRDFRAGHEGKLLSLPQAPEDLDKGDKVVVVLGRGLLGWWFREVRRPAAP